jgi:hypothetical protein
MQRRNRRAGVEDRWRRADGTSSARAGKGRRWLARYVDDQGCENSRSFERRVEAQAWLDEITASQVTGDEQELQHAIGELQFYSGQTVESGLRWKRNWDRERHRLRITMRKLREQQAPTEEKTQQTVQQGQQLIEDTDKVDGLLMECYRKLTKIVTGQEDSLIESKAFDPLTRQDYTFTVVPPWSRATFAEWPGTIGWTRRNDEADDVEDDIDFT